MNKSEMASALAGRTGLSSARARQVIDALFHPASGLISAELQKGGRVSLHEFGQFGTRDRPARQGKDIDVPARTACAFRPRKGLRSSLKDIVGA